MTSLTVEFLRIPIKVHFLGINLSPVKQEFRNTKYREFLGSPVVRTQYSHHQSPNYTLVGELRACKLRGISPPTKKKKKEKENTGASCLHGTHCRVHQREDEMLEDRKQYNLICIYGLNW